MAKCRLIVATLFGTSLVLGQFSHKETFKEGIRKANAEVAANNCDAIKTALESELRLWNSNLVRSLAYIEIRKENTPSAGTGGLFGLILSAPAQQADTAEKHGKVEKQGDRFVISIYGQTNAPLYLHHFLAHVAWDKIDKAQRGKITGEIQLAEAGFLAKDSERIATDYIFPSYLADSQKLTMLNTILSPPNVSDFIEFARQYWDDINHPNTGSFAKYSGEYVTRYGQLVQSLRARSDTTHPLVKQALELPISDKRIRSDQQTYLSELFVRLVTSYLDGKIDPNGKPIVESITYSGTPLLVKEQPSAKLPEIKCKI